MAGFFMRMKRTTFAAALNIFLLMWATQGNAAGTERVPVPEGGCDFVTPSGMLVGDAYPGYRSGQEPDNVWYESVELNDGARLHIRSGGCVDAVSQQFLLTIPHPDRDARDINYWSDYAQRTLATLKTRDGAAGTIASMREFLKQASKYKSHDGRIMMCRDGSTPIRGDCPWESGGSFLFEVKQVGKTLVIKAVQSQSA
jgi:hypothetical protein